MKPLQLIFALFFSLSWSLDAGAAISCIQNKTSGLFEGKGTTQDSAQRNNSSCDIRTLEAAIDMPPARKAVFDAPISPKADIDVTTPRRASATTISAADMQKMEKSLAQAPSPVAVAATVPVAVPEPVKAVVSWKIHKGEKIATALDRWTKTLGGWDFSWEIPAENDLVSDREVTITDLAFEQAVKAVIDALNSNGDGCRNNPKEPCLVARFNSLNQTNQVLRILEKK
jgi:hypothetical protein